MGVSPIVTPWACTVGAGAVLWRSTPPPPEIVGLTSRKLGLVSSTAPAVPARSSPLAAIAIARFITRLP